MGFLNNLFGSKNTSQPGSKNTSQPDVADLIVALGNKISDYSKKHGEKPKTIYILGDISNRLANARFYANVAHQGIYKGVEFVPVGGIPDGLIWMTDRDWETHPEMKAQREEMEKMIAEE
jgi:hypothetical protein